LGDSIVPILLAMRIQTDRVAANQRWHGTNTEQIGDIWQRVPSIPETCVMFATQGALTGECR
jgi:hypothetical protein